MKKLAVLTLLIAFVASCEKAPTQFVITGTVDTKNPIEEVSIPRGDSILVKAKVVDGKFTLTGVIDEPTYVTLNMGPAGAEAMVLENDNYEVVVNDDHKYIKGGTYNERIFGFKHTQEYLDAVKKFLEMYHVLTKDYPAHDLEAGRKIMEKVSPYEKAYRKIEGDVYASVIEGDAPTLLKAIALNLHYDWDNYGYERKVELLTQYNKDLPNNDFIIATLNKYKMVLEEHRKRQKTTAGNPFIDFTATTIDGKALTLSDVVAKNKYTLVEFWASWCSPCRGAFPHLKEMYTAYKEKGFEIYGISIDSKEDQFVKASKEENIPWLNTVDYEGFKSQAAEEYVVRAIPYTVLIGQDGVIVGAGENIRGLNLENKLKELFN
jgi:thiol-disulfide isomerase/thioredoxin